MNTAPFSNARPLNVSMMGTQASKVQTSRALTIDEHDAHEKAMSMTRSLQQHATSMERAENHHALFIKQRHESDKRQQRLDDLQKALPGMRSAGLASLNPRMGTCGSLPDMKRLRGPEGIEDWRTCTPWAVGGDGTPGIDRHQH